MERVYELLLGNGKVAEWRGTDGVDAARRYVDCMGGSVQAWREPRVELVIGVDPRRIIG